ncbi:Uncharacterised protein [Mesomycoplasma dispar]|uniref:Uncharacterized protein n=1 Tax=Mesomycoplasma dispar TaxID=86660 RepID=A0AAJ5TCU3_9BACT|nr:hypothetical protein [Mesomycoplasma dispar]AJR12355.1 hypothetical protein MDIS_03155 [Mesomycoplasma dispar]VEU62214.1 Uncharacterised protein [Mesomycoplasma dispar]
MKKIKKNLIKKVSKLFIFLTFSTLSIISATNKGLENQAVISQKTIENQSENSKNLYKITQMSAVSDNKNDLISPAVKEKIPPQKNGLAPAVPFLILGAGGILFASWIANQSNQNRPILPKLPNITFNPGRYSPQKPQKENDYQDAIVARTNNSITVDLNILASKTNTKLSSRAAALSKVEFVEVTSTSQLKKFDGVHLAYFFDNVPGYAPKFLISPVKISEALAWEFSVLSLQDAFDLKGLLYNNFFPNVNLEQNPKFAQKLGFKPNFYSYKKKKMKKLAYKVASTVNLLIGAKLGYNVPYLNNDSDENYPKSYYTVDKFIDQPFDKSINWYMNMPSIETLYADGKVKDKNREKRIKEKVDDKTILFRNYHVRRVKLRPNVDGEEKEKKDRIELKSVERIHYLYGDPIKFPH